MAKNLLLSGGVGHDFRLTTGEESLPSLWMAEKIISAGPAGGIFDFARLDGGQKENGR